MAQAQTLNENWVDFFELFSGLPKISSEREKKLVQFCEKYQENILAAMPWIASEIAGICGFANFFRLMYSHGGRKIYIPKSHQRFCELYSIDISLKDYQKIYKRVDSASYLELPSAWGIFMSIRRAAMLMAMKEDVSAILLTQTFGVTMRNIRMIKSRK